MLIVILVIVILLVAWSLYLMSQAIECREFSLMLAGMLVAFSAAAMIAVYFLVGSYIGYMADVTHAATVESVVWMLDYDSSASQP